MIFELDEVIGLVETVGAFVGTDRVVDERERVRAEGL